MLAVSGDGIRDSFGMGADFLLHFLIEPTQEGLDLPLAGRTEGREERRRLFQERSDAVGQRSDFLFDG